MTEKSVFNDFYKGMEFENHASVRILTKHLKRKIEMICRISWSEIFLKTNFKYVSAKIYLLKDKIETLEKGVKFVQI